MGPSHATTSAPLTIPKRYAFRRLQLKSPNAHGVAVASVVVLRHASSAALPTYQVAGRDALPSTAWMYDTEAPYYDDHQRWRRDSDVVGQTSLERSMSFESAPTPTPPRFPTIDVPHERVTTGRPLPATKTMAADTYHNGIKQEPRLIIGKKRQRYLRDVDRRSIIQRIDNGEKQADLAREFGVTRAAICHMKRNREEIVSRYESLLVAAKELDRVYSAPTDKNVKAVHELIQPSVQLFLTTLRDETTSHRTFCASADRLMVLLLEEAIASAATVSYTLCTTTGQTVRGVKATTRPLCCVGVGGKGWPLVELYRHIEPRSLIGSVDLLGKMDDVVVDYVDLPRELTTDTRMLLVSVSSASGESLCVSVEALLKVGVTLEDIQIAVLVCTSDVVDRVTTQFPGIRILTCAIEAPTTRSSPATTLTDFLDRYDAIKREPSAATCMKNAALDAWDESASRAVTSSNPKRW